MPPSAIVSVPVPRLPTFTPELLLQMEPAPVTVTVPVRAWTVADVGGEGGVIDDRPTVRDRERARAKTADIEPAAWAVVPGGARAGHRHRTSRAGRQSDGAAATTVHHAAVLDGKRARAQAADHEGLRRSSTLEPAPVTVTVPCPPGKLPINPRAIGQRTAVLDGKRARARAADDEVSDIRPRGGRAGYSHRALRTRLTANKPGGRLEQSQSPGAYGHRPAAAQD